MYNNIYTYHPGTVATIYKLTNLINNKSYIGFTSRDVNQRIKEHQNSASDSVIHKAIEKYGWDNFKFEILSVNTLPNFSLSILEPMFIKLYESFGSKGYNLTSGGVAGSQLSKESRRKISEANKGTVQSEEWKHKRRLYQMGNVPKYKGMKNVWKHTDETKKKISDANRGKSSWCKGKTGVYSKEALLKMKNAKLGKKLSDETKKKIGISQIGFKCSEESKRKISQSHIKRSKYIYMLVDPDGKEYTVDSGLIKFCSTHNLDQGNTSALCGGRLKQYKGWTGSRVLRFHEF